MFLVFFPVIDRFPGRTSPVCGWHSRSARRRCCSVVSAAICSSAATGAFGSFSWIEIDKDALQSQVNKNSDDNNNNPDKNNGNNELYDIQFIIFICEILI